MANGACFKHIAKIYASPARKVAVLPLLLLCKHLIEYKKNIVPRCITRHDVSLYGGMYYLKSIFIVINLHISTLFTLFIIFKLYKRSRFWQTID